ncbi:hypothetical protein, variant [Phytophthora nicotianae]|uniref:Leucine rich repeat containing 34 n=2 Tax=Phytophthora nicotianae TaxID=4792 RepID=V9EVW3_PHYNI|nr:hypothetical protein, variant [Phytophthora nicotianae P1569]ETL90055.1 hypothetical protein, variant [Phytophthora nicotianae]
MMEKQLLQAHAEGSAAAELPHVLCPYVLVLRERREGDTDDRHIALLMDNRSVSPERMIGGLLDFVSQINTPLVRLCLSKNPIGPEGARLLGSALVTNNTLQFLELEACDLAGSAYRPQHEGVLALAKGIQSVRSRLCYVNVASNDLQPQGCRILLGALSFHKTLTALDMSDNLLCIFNDKQGYLALSYLLQYSKQLCWLNIDDNPLTATAAIALKESLATNHSLTTLHASHCGITNDHWLNFSSGNLTSRLEIHYEPMMKVKSGLTDYC